MTNDTEPTVPIVVVSQSSELVAATVRPALDGVLATADEAASMNKLKGR